MNMTDFRIGIEEAFLESDIQLNNIDLLIERDMRTINIATRATALQCLKENAEIEDFFALEEASSESFFTKAKNFFIKIYEAVKKFITDCIERVRSFFQQKSAQRSIARLNAICKKIPKVRTITINVPQFNVNNLEASDRELAVVQTKIATTAGDIDAEIMIPRINIVDENGRPIDVAGVAATASSVGSTASAFTGSGLFEDGDGDETKNVSVLTSTTANVGNTVASLNKDLTILQRLQNTIKSVRDNTVRLFDRAKAKLGEIIGKIKEKLNQIFTVGKKRLTNLRNGVKALMKSITAKISSAFQAVRGFVVKNNGTKTVGNTTDKADTTNKEVGKPASIPSAGEPEKLDDVHESALDDILAEIYSESQLYDELDDLDF